MKWVRLISVTIPLALGPLALAAQPVIDLPIGSKAPDLALETLDGKPTNLSALLGKKPLLVEIWAAWCENCMALEPKILAAKKRYGDRVHFAAIAVSYNQSPERVRRHMNKNGFDLDMYYDRKGEADAVYGVKATSTVIVIDAEGIIVYAGAGGDQDIDAAVRKALKS